MNKIMIIVGVILGILGLIFSFLPPEVHMSLLGGSGSIDNEMGDEMNNEMDNMDHGSHNHGAFVTWGISAAIIGLALVFAGGKLF